MRPHTWLVLPLSALLSTYTQLAAAESPLWYERDSPIGIAQDLGPRLSKRAKVVLKGEEGFEERTARWQRWKEPDVVAVVDVKKEEDVEKTVC